MKMKNNQYEIAVDIDEYMFDRDLDKEEVEV